MWKKKQIGLSNWGYMINDNENEAENEPRPRHGHKYNKCKISLIIIMVACIKQHLSNIWC